MISFGLSEEQRAIREQVRRFAAACVWTLRSCEEVRGVSPELCARYRDIGLSMLEYPSHVGGWTLAC